MIRKLFINNNSINNNINKLFINSNSNISVLYSKRLYCNKIEIDSLRQSFNELNKLDIKQVEKEGLPSNLIQVQKDILKCKENELNTQTRVISSLFLWKSLCYLNLTPNTIKKEELEKLWKLINIDSKDINNKNEYISILNHRIGMSFTSRYLIPKLYDDIKSVIKEIGRGEIDKSKLIPLINVSFGSSAHLDMWKEMKYLGNQLESLNNGKSILENSRNAAFNIDYIFDYYSIYNIINQQISNTSLSPLIVNVNKESEPPIIENFKSFRVYDVESFGFKNLSMKTENMSNEVKEKAINEFNDNLKQMVNQKMDRNGYFITELSYPPFISIFGSAFKFDVCFDTNHQMTHSGILNKEFTKVQLYGTYDEFDNTKVESEYSLEIDQPVQDELQSFIQLKGTHRKIETRPNGEITIYDMNVVINLQRRKLLYEQENKTL